MKITGRWPLCRLPLHLYEILGFAVNMENSIFVA